MSLTVLSFIFALYAGLMLLHLLKLRRESLRRHPFKNLLLLCLVIFSLFCGALTLLAGFACFATELLAGEALITLLPVLAVLNLVCGILLIFLVLSFSNFTSVGILKKTTFTLFWFFFILWNAGVWGITAQVRQLFWHLFDTGGELGERYTPYEIIRSDKTSSSFSNLTIDPPGEISYPEPSYTNTEITTSRTLVPPPESVDRTENPAQTVSPNGME